MYNLDTTMIHLKHPCYDYEFYEAENAEDVEVCKSQGYHTLREVIQLARKALEKHMETCQECGNEYMHLLTNNSYYCDECGNTQS